MGVPRSSFVRTYCLRAEKEIVFPVRRAGGTLEIEGVIGIQTPLDIAGGCPPWPMGAFVVEIEVCCLPCGRCGFCAHGAAFGNRFPTKAKTPPPMAAAKAKTTASHIFDGLLSMVPMRSDNTRNASFISSV